MIQNLLLLKNATLFDSITGKMKEGQSILIENNLISTVDDEGSLDQSTVSESIDMSGKYLIPGLIDCHVHLGGTTRVDWAKEMMRNKDIKFHYVALKNAQKHLVSGFTTVRDCGGDKWGAPLKRVFEENLFRGPRLLTAQWTISQWGNQEVMGPDDWIDIGKKREVISGPYGVMHAVRERKRMGSDFIKTMTTGGVLHGIESQLERSLWTDEELDVMVKESHRLGMHVAVHAHGREGIYNAAKAKVDTIEHCSFVNEESAKLMKQNNVALVPTQTSAFMDKPDLMEKLDPEVRIKTIEVDTAMFENHKIAFENGVMIACGTDAGVPGNPHGTSAREISMYIKHIEMTPSEALQSATINAAKAIKMENLVGSVQAGKYADIVVFDQNPLENIGMLESLTNISMVIKGGKAVARNGKLIHE